MPNATSITLGTKPANDQLKTGLRAAWKDRPESTRSQSSVVTAQPPAAPLPAPDNDLATFRAALAGTRPLPPDNRVQLGQPPSRRLPPRPTPQSRADSIASPRLTPDDGLPPHWHREAPLPPRLPRDPDAAALIIAMQGVVPLPDCNRVALGTPPPAPRPRQFLKDERAALHESLHGQIGLQDRLEGGDEPHYLRPGLPAHVLRDLRRGRWVTQAELDLHGLNRDEARQQLADFLARCLHDGRRCVRIIHGKGHGSPQKLSILRQLVRGWLAQRQEILAYCQARPHDGGEGALIALLRAARK